MPPRLPRPMTDIVRLCPDHHHWVLYYQDGRNKPPLKRQCPACKRKQGVKT